MEPEELLIPRIKIIAPWPGMSSYLINVGDIITDNGKEAAVNQKGNSVFAIEWKDYPHLFQFLCWWEDRPINDMPAYLKIIKKTNGTDRRGEIIKAIPGGFRQGWDGYCVNAKGFVSGFDNILLDCFYPVAETEYQKLKA